jgi:hypothetical protein
MLLFVTVLNILQYSSYERSDFKRRAAASHSITNITTPVACGFIVKMVVVVV